MLFKKLLNREVTLSLSALFLCISIISLWPYDDLTRYIHPRYELFTVTLITASGVLLSINLFSNRKLQNSTSVSASLTFVFCTVILFLPVQTLSSRAALNREQSNYSVEEVSASSYDDFSQDYSNLTISGWSSLLAKQPPAEQIQDKTAVIEGFALYDNTTVSIARFRISCCAVDATPVTIRVRNSAGNELSANNWYRITGSFTEVDGDFILVPEDITSIEEPDNPYVF